ncbi:DUF2794 domain-containing protein [Rhodobacteraceae bacterium RKSG542]|uniref:DUF2794 domain-containing protein n=1 Tax=Pseudovibrio flavus TaxID=2529854 RepID=UPI0012BCA4FB|nr:DUF2794 domain-containing protein [Pseudovibrio flavus]MTI18285.1 DUF2794 domain-containing protein [Pseudovibrio flavus]
MSDSEESVTNHPHNAGAGWGEGGGYASLMKTVAFHRTELSQILNVYGRMVAAGEWKDYAIDHGSERAVFSIFRRASEMPLYRIEKDPKLARKQGAYSVISMGGTVLKRGHELANVLKVFDKKKHLRLVE